MALTRIESRSRVMAALFSGATLMNAAMAVASAVGTIVAADRLGARWGGVPSTAGIVGIGALALTWLMNRRGRRTGLVAGYLASACGAVLAAVAVAAVDVLLLSIGMMLLGWATPAPSCPATRRPSSIRPGGAGSPSAWSCGPAGSERSAARCFSVPRVRPPPLWAGPPPRGRICSRHWPLSERRSPSSAYARRSPPTPEKRSTAGTPMMARRTRIYRVSRDMRRRRRSLASTLVLSAAGYATLAWAACALAALPAALLLRSEAR